MNKDDENYKNRKKIKDISTIIHHATYDTHFIMNQLAEEFKGELDCIGENMEKYITFSTPIKKKCDDGKTITHRLRHIDSSDLWQLHYQNLLITCLEILIV